MNIPKYTHCPLCKTILPSIPGYYVKRCSEAIGGCGKFSNLDSPTLGQHIQLHFGDDNKSFIRINDSSTWFIHTPGSQDYTLNSSIYGLAEELFDLNNLHTIIETAKTILLFS